MRSGTTLFVCLCVALSDTIPGNSSADSNDYSPRCHETRDYEILITLFTTWSLKRHRQRPFVYKNMLKNWQSLGPRIKIAVLTNDTVIIQFCKDNGVDVMPLTSTVSSGKPLIRPMCIEVMKRHKSSFYGFVNSDNLIIPSLSDILSLVQHSSVCNDQPIFIMGARTNVFVTDETLPKLGSSLEDVENITRSKGFTLSAPFALDYYMTSLYYPWSDTQGTSEDLVHGNGGLDNYLIWNALRLNHTTNVTNAFLTVHQSYHAVSDSDGGSRYNVELMKKVHVNIDYDGAGTDCAEFIVGFEHDTHTLILMENTFRQKRCYNLYARNTGNVIPRLFNWFNSIW